MNKQGKNGIEWCTYTWSPVTGCLHGCEYCYARKIANRFGGYSKELASEYQTPIQVYSDCGVIAALKYPLMKHTSNGEMQASYPFGFDPTFHRYRLSEPQQVKKPSKIFVCSMADLFGEWIPDEWIDEVFQACFNADRHKYLFLTKNPARYKKAIVYTEGEERGFEPEHWNSMWFGTTITCQEDMDHIPDLLRFPEGYKFISVEPLLGEIDLMRIGGDQFGWGRRDALNGLHYTRANATEGGCEWEHEKINKLDWVIIGQQTNPDRPPKDEWVKSIIDQCRAADVPVFVKSPLYEKFPIQEWPEGLK